MSTNPYVVTPEMVDDTVTNAMEGGSTYWADSVVVIGKVDPSVKSTLFPGDEPFTSEMLTKGHDLKWTDGTDGKTYTLTLAAMKRGIRKAAAHFGQTPVAFWEDGDSGTADVAVQIALFGEIVYG